MTLLNKPIPNVVLRSGNFRTFLITLLKKLWLSDNNLTVIPEDLVSYAPELEELYLDGNSLQEIPSTLFDRNDSLKTVLFKGNPIKELPKEVIERFKKQRIYTDHPSVVALAKEYSITQLLEDLRSEGKTPQDLVEDRILNLSNRQLTSLDGIDALKELEANDIDLSNNYISHIPERALSGFREEIYWLRLDGNQLSSLPKALFGENVPLLELNISDNKFTELPDLNKYPNLRAFNARGNEVTHLRPTTFNRLQWLVEVHIEQNNLAELPPNLFKDNKMLKVVHLQENKIETFPPDIFDGLDELIELDLSDNRLGCQNEYVLPTIEVIPPQDEFDEENRGLVFEPQNGAPSLSVLSIRALLQKLQGLPLEKVIDMIGPFPKNQRHKLIGSASQELRRILRSANAIIDTNYIIATTDDKDVLLATIKKLSPKELQILMNLAQATVRQKVEELHDPVLTALQMIDEAESIELYCTRS